MPELPEVETMARDLENSVRGATIRAVHVHRRDVLRENTGAAFVKRLTGTTFNRFWRRAKYVVADLSSGEKLVVSPRFTGSLLVEDGPYLVDRSDYTCIQFSLGDGRRLRFRDVRRLGTVAVMSEGRFNEWHESLGPEPLDPSFTVAQFSAMVRASARAIKTVLMDQHRIAGIGNIYANEALWRAQIRPSRRGTSVTRAQAAALLTEARAVLTAAVEQRGTSFRD